MKQTASTGDCFIVAGHMVMDDDDLTLVHGLAVGQGPIEGVMHWHAWVERSSRFPMPDGRHVDLTVVVDRSNGKDVEMPAALYYKIGRVGETRRYTPTEARVEMLRHEHWGPWPLPPKGPS